jgi:hypothetical protein
METLSVWVDDDSDRWEGWENVFGPGLLLVGLGSSVLANSVWGRMIGDVACSWRLAFSPRGPAFSIWGVIYLWTAVSVLLQFLSNMDAETWYVPDFGVNVLMCVAWLVCSLWIWFFSLADSNNVKDGLGWAACCLVVAASCAVAAVCWERSWPTGNTERILAVGVPFSLFAGWLCLASSLSVGVFLASQTRPADSCGEDGRLIEVRDPGTVEMWAPVVLAVVVSAFSIGLPDPVLVLPLCWGTYWMDPSVRTGPGIVAIVALSVAGVRSGILIGNTE